MKDHQIHQGVVSTSFLRLAMAVLASHFLVGHIWTKINGFLALQPHWKHSGQQKIFYGPLVIVEFKHILFNIQLSQFNKIL